MCPVGYGMNQGQGHERHKTSSCFHTSNFTCNEGRGYVPKLSPEIQHPRLWFNFALKDALQRQANFCP